MIAFRPITPDDLAFVVSSWSSSYKSAHAAGMIFTDDWGEVMHRQIKRIVSWGDTTTIVGYESDDPTFLYGFISGDTVERVPVVWYVFVKAPYRRSGTARGLFDALGVAPDKPFNFACRTAVVSRLVDKIPYGRCNPIIARFAKETRPHE